MAKRKKKLNKGLAVFCGTFFLIAGFVLGIVGKSFLFHDSSYVIPEAEKATTHISAGSIDVDVIKEEDLSIHFIELGNKYTGDCTFIKVGDVEILIDAGSRATSVEPIYSYIWPYIDAGDDVLEYVVVTHAHQDHYAGFATNNYEDSLFGKLECENIITFSKSNQKPTAKLFSNFNNNVAKEKLAGANVYSVLDFFPNPNQKAVPIDLGNNVELEFLYHKFYELEAHSENDYSVSCMINQDVSPTESKHYLFTGDLESEGEISLVNEYKNRTGNNLPHVELYKAGHHGSKTSSSETLLNAIQPEIVCVCACAGSSEYTSKNENQFPTQAFINRVGVWTKNIYVTSLCIDYVKGSFTSMNGNIVVTSSGSASGIYCSNNTTILKETEWFKNNRTWPSNGVA